MFANMSIEEFNVPECPVVSRGKQNNSTEQEIDRNRITLISKRKKKNFKIKKEMDLKKKDKRETKEEENNKQDK